MAGARDVALPHAASENVPLPLWETIASIEGQPRRRDCRHPEHQRRLHSFLPRPVVHARAKIETAEADDRPPIVLAGLEDVDLLPAVRTLLRFPDGAGIGGHGEPPRVAMPEPENPGP